MNDTLETRITIDVMQGGFVITYPDPNADPDVDEQEIFREVFTSIKKLNKRLQTLLQDFALTPYYKNGY